MVGKNLRPIARTPLVGIAITQAQESGCFERIVCSTDSQDIARVATDYGAEVIHRPGRYATAEAPDIWWVNHAIDAIDWDGDGFAILRPTNPFRTAATIRRGVAQFAQGEWDSLRAVQKVSERPEKMWRLSGGLLAPYSQGFAEQSSTFEPLWVQNGCLEIARLEVLPRDVHGKVIGAFLTEGWEGLDINTESDYEYALWVAERFTSLPDRATLGA